MIQSFSLFRKKSTLHPSSRLKNRNISRYPSKFRFNRHFCDPKDDNQQKPTGHEVQTTFSSLETKEQESLPISVLHLFTEQSNQEKMMLKYLYNQKSLREIFRSPIGADIFYDFGLGESNEMVDTFFDRLDGLMKEKLYNQLDSIDVLVAGKGDVLLEDNSYTSIKLPVDLSVANQYPGTKDHHKAYHVDVDNFMYHLGLGRFHHFSGVNNLEKEHNDLYREKNVIPIETSEEEIDLYSLPKDKALEYIKTHYQYRPLAKVPLRPGVMELSYDTLIKKYFVTGGKAYFRMKDRSTGAIWIKCMYAADLDTIDVDGLKSLQEHYRKKLKNVGANIDPERPRNIKKERNYLKEIIKVIDTIQTELLNEEYK